MNSTNVAAPIIAYADQPFEKRVATIELDPEPVPRICWKQIVVEPTGLDRPVQVEGYARDPHVGRTVHVGTHGTDRSSKSNIRKTEFDDSVECTSMETGSNPVRSCNA